MIGYLIAPDALAARLLPGDRRVAIRRLSPEGAVLAAPGGGAPPLTRDERLALDLGGGLSPLAATVTEAEAGVVRFDVSMDVARDIVRLLDRLLAHKHALPEEEHVVEHEVIRAPDRIRTVLHATFANRRHARVRLPGDAGSQGSRLSAARLEPESPLPLQWEPDERWPEPPFEISVDGYMSQVQFQVTRAENVDGFLAVPIPTELVRVRSRRQRRVGAPAGVVVRFSHPRWPGVRVRRAIKNVSADGLLFETSAVKDLIYPGLVLERITIEWQGRLTLTMSGVVCHVSDDIDGVAELAGVQLRFADRDERAHWETEVDQLLYPNTRADGTWSEQIWELYRSSGYFELSQKSESEFAALREAFRATAPRLAGSELGARVVWPSARGLEASVSTLRVYEHSCVPFALARQPGRVPLRYPGRSILRDIYLHGFERLARAPDLRWLIVWVQKEGRFSRLVHFDMARRYTDVGRADILHFRALEARTDEPRQPLPDGIEIGEALPRDLEAFFAAISSTRSQLDREAHDLVPERFALSGLKRSWRLTGLHRGRRLLIARRRGRPQAAAVLEAADDGLHLFCLLDLARMFALEPGGETLFPHLLDEARAWYAELGKTRFIYFCEELTPQPPALRDLGEADAIVLPADLLPELLEHLYEVTAPRDVPRLRDA